MKIQINIGKEEREQILGMSTFQNYQKVIRKLVFRIQKAIPKVELRKKDDEKEETIETPRIPGKVEPMPIPEPKQEVIPNGTTKPNNPN